MSGTLSNRFGSAALIGLLLAAWTLLPAASAARASEASVRNLLVNPEFARTYTARPSPDNFPRNMPALNKDAAMPAAWTVQPFGGPTSGNGPTGLVARRGMATARPWP